MSVCDSTETKLGLRRVNVDDTQMLEWRLQVSKYNTFYLLISDCKKNGNALLSVSLE